MTHWHLHPQLDQDTHWVASLPLCELRLMDDATYPWLILVPRVAGVCELIELEAAQRQQLTAEMDQCSHALKQLFAPDKLNVAALGNMVAQLHVHVIARFHTDAAWPAPVWGKATAQPYTPEALQKRLQALRQVLGA